MIIDKEKIMIGILFFVLTAVLVYMMYAGLNMIWYYVDDTILKYFLLSITIIFPLLAIFSIVYAMKLSFPDTKGFSEGYKSEALIVDIAMRKISRGGGYVSFDLVLEIKHTDGSSYKTNAYFRTPIRNMDQFKIGKTIIVDVSANDSNKVRVSDDTFK